MTALHQLFANVKQTEINWMNGTHLPFLSISMLCAGKYLQNREGVCEIDLK